MLFLIVTNEVKELENLSKGDEILMEYEKKIKDLSEDEVFLNLYDEEEEARMIQNAKEAYHKKIAREEGLKEGVQEEIKQGIEQGKNEGEKSKQLEIAKNMLNKGMDLELVLDITGISKEELKNIKY